MNIDVGKAIQELLYEHPVVIVPGFGGFTSAPQSATVDYVQGVVTPPIKKLEFNPNLVINDGVLVHHIQKASTVTFQDAKEAIDRFVEDMKQALEQREIVEITHVGRLYKDYEHKIKFMPEGMNFNPDTFGLPPVQFSPVVRERPPAMNEPKSAPPPITPVQNKTAPAEPAAAATATKKSSGGGFIQGMLPWLVLASAVVIALSIYLMFGGGDDTGTAGIDKGRLNVKPTQEQTDEGSQTSTAGTENATADNETSPVSKENITDAAGGQKEQSASGSKQCLLIVHSFSKKANAVKFAEQLAYDGYSVETKVVGPLNRVGVSFSYNSQADIEKMRKELAGKYNAGPKVFGQEE